MTSQTHEAQARAERRAKFEKWAKSKGFHVMQRGDDPQAYTDLQTDFAWTAWLAALSASDSDDAEDAARAKVQP